MRLDKYLKNARLIKRRTLANQACEQGRVKLNGRTAKPGAQVKTGDILEIRFGSNISTVEITAVKEHVSKNGAAEMYVKKS